MYIIFEFLFHTGYVFAEHLKTALNGSHGEWTNGDDMEASITRTASKADVVADNKRAQKVAKKNQNFTKAGNSHKSKNGNKSPEAAQDALSIKTEPLTPGSDDVLDVEPEVKMLDVVTVKIPSQRKTSIIQVGYHPFYMRCIFFNCSHALLLLASWIFTNTELTFDNSVVMLILGYLSCMRYLTRLDATLFLLWFPYCNEYRRFRESLMRKEFSSINFGYNKETILGVIGFMQIFIMSAGTIWLKIACAFLYLCCHSLYDAITYDGINHESSVLYGERCATIYDRYDASSWSYKAGSSSYYEGAISQQLNIILINEFATSSARVKGTSDRMLYAAIEHAKKFHHDDGREKYQIVINTVKYATQELLATQHSMNIDGGLAARPLVLPIR